MNSEGEDGTCNEFSGVTHAPVLQGRDFTNVTVNIQAAVPPVALNQLPPPVIGFTGRKTDLAQVAWLLNPAAGAGATNSMRTVVLSAAGLAGVGKTALAVQAAHAARERGWFPGGILLINLHGYEDDDARVQPGQALDALLRALGVPAEYIPGGDEPRTALYRSKLAQISDPVLIIADNASAEEQVEPLLPGSGPHRVIITSRNNLASRLGARLLQITVLDQTDSVKLLDAVVRVARPADERISSDPAATQLLAEACGGLPLALQIIAAQMVHDPTLEAAELARDLADEMQRLSVLSDDENDVSVRAAFELSYRNLNKDATRLFRLLPTDRGPDLSKEAAAALADWPASKTRKVLGQLHAAHLVDGATGRWRMHDLLRLYARELPDEGERDQATGRLLDWYLRGAEEADDRLKAGSSSSMPAEFDDRFTPQEWLGVNRPGLIAAVNLAVSTSRDQAAMSLPLALSRYLLWQWRLDDMLEVTGISLNTGRRLGNRGSEAKALNWRGGALRGAQRFDEAISDHEAAAAIFEEEEDQRSRAGALVNLTAALAGANQLEQAIAVGRHAAEIFNQIGDQGSRGMALANLGDVLGRVGRFDGAISACREAIELLQKTGDQHTEGVARHNLGIALIGLKRFDEGINACRGAIELLRRTGDRHTAAMVLEDRGAALRKMGLFDEAISGHEAARGIYRETGDQDSEERVLKELELDREAQTAQKIT